MKRRLLALLLVLAMCFTMLPMTAMATGYSDTAGHWGEDAIMRWSGYGVIRGSNGKFNPNANLRKGDLAVILANTLGLTEMPDTNPFIDLYPTDYYYEAVLQCYAAGILSGFAGNVYPKSDVSRQDAMLMCAKALGIEPTGANGFAAFSDGTAVASYAAPYLAAMVELGVISGAMGADGTMKLSPGNPINRASLVTILHQAIPHYINEPGEYEIDGGFVVVAADDVTLTGEMDDVLIAPSAEDVKFEDAEVSGTVTINAPGADVKVDEDSTIERIVSNADDVTISGEGTVENAYVAGDDTEVNTDGTKLEVADGADGVTENGKKVKEGTSTITEEAKPVTKPSGSSHKHKYSSQWTSDETYHWHAATCSHDVTKDKAAHTEEIIPAVAPTCSTAGKTEGKKCSVCDYIIVNPEDIATTPHTPAAIPAEEATCSEPGKTAGEKCSVCGTITVEPQDTIQLGHTEEILEAEAPTCTKPGKTEGKKCSVCDETIVAQTEIKATGHTPGAAATCTTDQTCVICGDIVKNKKGHTEETISGTDATCTAAGLSDGKKCSVCGEILVAQTNIPALGHDFSGEYKNTEADGHSQKCSRCEVYGTVTAHTYAGTACTTADSCTICGYTKEAGTHAWGPWAANDNAATHTHTCTKCSEGTETKNHSWDAGVATTPATCTTAGVKTVTCSDCGATKTEEITKLDHSYTVAQKDENHHWNKCATCVAIDENNKAEHTYGTPVVDGFKKTETCTVETCKHEKVTNYQAKIGDTLYATIEAALTYAQETEGTETITVAPGVYNDAITIDTAVVFDGDNGAIFTGGMTVNAAGVTVQNCTFTTEEVRKQVLERCDIFAKDGGFIFNAIHNIQYGTPVENIVAMIDAVHEFNGK